jgi:hypothetical protein
VISLDPSKGLRVREFFETEAEALFQKVKIIETLLPSRSGGGASNKGEEGRYIEALIRGFLNQHLPDELKAVSGFILLPSTKTGADDLQRVEAMADRHSRQLDVLVYDFANYPVYERSEEFCIVPPDGVVAVISIKKTLRAQEVAAEIKSLTEVSALCSDAFLGAPLKIRSPYTAIFAFSAEQKGSASDPKLLFDRIRPELDGNPYDHMVTEVSVFRRYTIFKYSERDSPDGTARYVSVDGRNKGYISLQRMIQSILSVYYDRTRRLRSERPGFVSFEKGTFQNAARLGDVLCDSTVAKPDS